MKIEHEKVPVTEFVPGSVYRVGMNGTDLYTAEVIKFHGGCWATVRVKECLYPAMKADYAAGNEFDIKVAMYDLQPAMPADSKPQ
jgi:hypothetical protein